MHPQDDVYIDPIAGQRYELACEEMRLSRINYQASGTWRRENNERWDSSFMAESQEYRRQERASARVIRRCWRREDPQEAKLQCFNREHFEKP